MLRMGIVGAENSHAAAVSKLLNVEQVAPGVNVTHLWGETRAFALATAEAGQIPAIVREPAEMIGQIDAVMIDHRHGKHHLGAAEPFLRAGLPCFIDKPLTASLAEAKRLLALRRKHGAVVTSFSAVPLQSSVATIKAEIATLGAPRVAHLTGPGDRKSKYGGIFFYGIHLAELLVTLYGPDVKSVEATANGGRCTILCHYPDDLIATMTLNPDGPSGWTVTAAGAEGVRLWPVVTDANMYMNGIRLFIEMFLTGEEPLSDARMLAPIAILEAAERALTEKTRIRVPSLTVKAA